MGFFDSLHDWFGSVDVAGQRYTRRRIQALSAEELAQLALQAVEEGNGDATRWVFAALATAAPPPERLLDLVRSARALPADPAVALVGGPLARGAAGSDLQLEAARELLELARWELEAGQGSAARQLIERDLPEVTGGAPASAELAVVLLEAATIADERHWSSAVLVLLDPSRVDPESFSDATQAARASRLIGVASGDLVRLQAALELNPDDPRTHFALGRAHRLRARGARGTPAYEQERTKALEHLEDARTRVDLEDALVVVLLADIASAYDDMLYGDSDDGGDDGGGDE